jgi:hypothetical protein
MTLLVFGQRTETAINLTQEKSRLVFEVENDLLFQSDNYYTAGLAISYTNKYLKNTPTQLILKSKNKENFIFSGFGIQQRIFTPYSISEPSAIENDRPYSAYLLATNFSVLINADKKLKLSNEIGVGIMGKIAGGKEVQTFIHNAIGSVTPVGWDSQLENAFLFDYQFRIEKAFFSDWIAEHFTPFTAARIGTLTDRVQIGLMTKWGNKSKTLINATIPYELKKQFIWEWVFEANLQGVFYDATLEGGLFNGKEAIDLSKQEIISRQYQLRMGVNFYYKKLSFRYMVKFNSTDFVTAVVHRYASVNIGVSF